VSFLERRPAIATLLLFGMSCALSVSIAAALVWLGVLRAPWLEDLELAYQLRTAPRKDLRILVLGDSFLASWSTDPHLKKDLAAYAAERGVGVINTADYGHGPANYYAQMQKVATEFKPGLVLLFYFVGNDLTDTQYRGPAFVRAGPDAGRRMTIPRKCRVPLPLDPDELFDWDAMVEHGIDSELIELARSGFATSSSRRERINPWLLALAMRSPRFLFDNILIDTECNRAAWRLTARFLSGIFEIAREVGADVNVIAIPDSVQIDRSNFDLYRKATIQVDDRLLASTRPQQLLSELCARHGVPMLDLLPIFEIHPDPASLYWRFDPHFSPEGHRLAFQILREAVLDPWVAYNQPEETRPRPR
jgi:hypothetical protein